MQRIFNWLTDLQSPSMQLQLLVTEASVTVKLRQALEGSDVFLLCLIDLIIQALDRS